MTGNPFGEVAGLFAAGSTRVHDVDIRPSVSAWVDSAYRLDEDALCLALGTVADDTDPAVLGFARLLVGDHVGAMTILAPELGTVSAPGTQPRLIELVAAAALSSGGDDDAHRWLHQTAASAAGQPWEGAVTLLLAVVAEQRRDFRAADRGWLTAIGTGASPLVRGHAVALHLHLRLGEDASSGIRRLSEAMGVLVEGRNSVRRDARAIEIAVDALRARDDVAGARLLLQMATRWDDVPPRLSEELAALAPQPQTRRHRLLVGFLWALSPVLLLTGVAAFALLPASIWAFRRLVPVPGLDRVDSEGFRALAGMRRDPATGLFGAGTQHSGWGGLALLLGGIVGAIVGGSLASSIDPANTWAVASAWLIPLFGIPTLAVVCVRRWGKARYDRNRRSTYDEKVAAQLRDFGSCQCFDTATLVDELADAYAQRHLRPGRWPEEAAAVAGALGQPVELLVCPQLSVPWLVVRVTSDGATLALRGEMPARDTGSATEVGLYL